MEKIISKLVEFDHEGQKIVQDAQAQKEYTLAHMGDYKKEMSDQYRKRSDNRIEFFRQQAKAETDEQCAHLHQEYSERMDKLKLLFDEKSKSWVQEVVNRCIGG